MPRRSTLFWPDPGSPIVGLVQEGLVASVIDRWGLDRRQNSWGRGQIGEREKREEGEKKKNFSSLFGFPKPNFILLSVFQNEISCFRIFYRVYDFQQSRH